MSTFPKPIIVVSKCLEFEACRYNGQVIHDDLILKLQKHVHFVPVCPEYEIGLGIPRDPIRVVKQNGQSTLLQPSTGKDLTTEMNQFADSFLHSLEEVDGFILKNRSPSCGIKDVKIYTGQEEHIPIGKGSGLFAAAVLQQYPYKAIEDEGRLKNQHLKDHFLTKLYTLASFRQIKKTKDHKQLIDFHSKNKYLLMAYHQQEQKVLGQIVANHDHKSWDDMISMYESHLGKAFESPPGFGPLTNALMHIMGYFSKDLISPEKQFILETFEQYRNGHLPLCVPLTLLKSWVIRFEQEYLENQTIFEPYPFELTY